LCLTGPLDALSLSLYFLSPSLSSNRRIINIHFITTAKLGLDVKPGKGKALVWPSVTNNDPQRWDPRMFHEARDVIRGEKRAANHWIHLYDYETPNLWGCTGSFS